MPFEVVACALTLSFPKTFLETAVNKHAKLWPKEGNERDWNDRFKKKKSSHRLTKKNWKAPSKSRLVLTNLDQFNKLLVSKSISHVEIRSLRAKKKTKVFSETGYWFAGREVCGEKRSNPPYCKSGSFLSRPPCLHKILFPNVKPHTCTVLSIDLGGVGKLSSFIITPFDDSYTPTTLDMLPYWSMIDVTFPWNKCNKVKKKVKRKWWIISGAVIAKQQEPVLASKQI